MSAFRNPVPGTIMKRPLRCIDLDVGNPDHTRHIGTQRQEEFKALAKGHKFICPNRRAKNSRCSGGAWWYPRKWSSKGYLHFHQGIDLGQLDPKSPEAADRANAGGLNVLSVTSGRVVHTKEWDGKKAGDGTVVGIYDDVSRRLFWYAHCEAGSIQVKTDNIVVADQVIARVGNTGKAGTPHLHFEVIDAFWGGRSQELTRVLGGQSWEQGIGTLHRDSPRLDPLKVLEELGPWGPRQLFGVDGVKVSDERITETHRLVESTPGGTFPLGANNVWHGGVHIPMPANGCRRWATTLLAVSRVPSPIRDPRLPLCLALRRPYQLAVSAGCAPRTYSASPPNSNYGFASPIRGWPHVYDAKKWSCAVQSSKGPSAAAPRCCIFRTAKLAT